MVATKKLTIEDFWAFPDDDVRREVIDGEVYIVPPPVTAHQRILRRLVVALNAHVEDQHLGEVFFAPFAVALSPHDVFEPDLIFVSNERLDIVERKGIEGAPDLCVEVASPSTRKRDRILKVERYAMFGVREYWIVDPDAETIEVFAREDDAFVSLGIVQGETMIPSRVLPDLRLRADAVFAAPSRR